MKLWLGPKDSLSLTPIARLHLLETGLPEETVNLLITKVFNRPEALHLSVLIQEVQGVLRPLYIATQDEWVEDEYIELSHMVERVLDVLPFSDEGRNYVENWKNNTIPDPDPPKT